MTLAAGGTAITVSTDGPMSDPRLEGVCGVVNRIREDDMMKTRVWRRPRG